MSVGELVFVLDGQINKTSRDNFKRHLLSFYSCLHDFLDF